MSCSLVSARLDDSAERQRCQEILAAVEPFHRIVCSVSESNFSPSSAVTEEGTLTYISRKVCDVCNLNSMWTMEEQYQLIRQDEGELVRVFKAAIKKVGMYTICKLAAMMW